MTDNTNTDATTTDATTTWAEGLSADLSTYVHDKGFTDVASIVTSLKETEGKVGMWKETLSPEQKGLIESKGFENIGMLVDSYGNLEKLKGVPAEKLLKIPEKGLADDPETWGSVFDKLGRPKDANGYDIKMQNPEDANEQKAVEWAKGTFHKLGLTKAQGEQFIDQWNDLAAQNAAEADQRLDAQIKEADKNLRVEWGRAYEKNKSIAVQAAKKFGLDENSFSKLQGALGYAEAMKLFQQVGAALGEHNFVDGKAAGSGVMTPDAAKYQINQLTTDPEFQAKFASGNVEAKAKWDKLLEMAYLVEDAG